MLVGQALHAEAPLVAFVGDGFFLGRNMGGTWSLGVSGFEDFGDFLMIHVAFFGGLFRYKPWIFDIRVSPVLFK